MKKSEKLTAGKTVKNLRKSRASSLRFFDLVTDAITLFDAQDGRFVDANKATIKLYGYTREEFLNLHFLDTTAEPLESAASIQKVIEHRGDKISLRYHRKKDGTAFPVELSATAIVDNGRTLICAIARDVTERKHLENALTDSENRYRQLVDKTDTGFVAIDETGIVHEANEPYVRLTGARDATEVIGHSVIEWTAPDEREHNAAAVALCARQGYIRNFETIYQHHDGTRINLFINATIQQVAGKIHMISLCRDITDRKREQNRVLESEEKYRRLFETITDAFMIYDTTIGRFVETNEAAQKLYGYTREEFFGLDNLALTAEPNESAATYQGILNGTVERISLRYHKRKDGTTFPVDIMTNTLTLGGHTLIYAIIRDVTDQKRAGDELAARERTLRTLLDSFPHLAMLLDTKATILAINDAMCKHHQKDREQLLGTNVRDHVSPHVFEKRWSLGEKVIASGKAMHFEDEVNGTILTHSFFPVFGPDGHAVGFTVLAQDITQERKLEKEVEKYREKMMNAERLATVGTMSAMIAHQLNQPLTVIRLLTQEIALSLKTGKTMKSAAEHSDEVLKEIDKASVIVKNLLTRCRLPSGNGRQAVNVMQILGQIFNLFASTATRMGMKLVLDDDLKDIPTLTGNPVDFEKLFFALVENAMHAAEGKHDCQLWTRGWVDGTGICVEFSDTCGGIEPENLEKIFEPFFTTKSPEQGTGLGLCIAKRIVEDYGGSIAVESHLGRNDFSYTAAP